MSARLSELPKLIDAKRKQFYKARKNASNADKNKNFSKQDVADRQQIAADFEKERDVLQDCIYCKSNPESGEH